MKKLTILAGLTIGCALFTNTQTHAEGTDAKCRIILESSMSKEKPKEDELKETDDSKTSTSSSSSTTTSSGDSAKTSSSSSSEREDREDREPLPNTEEGRGGTVGKPKTGLRKYLPSLGESGGLLATLLGLFVCLFLVRESKKKEEGTENEK